MSAGGDAHRNLCENNARNDNDPEAGSDQPAGERVSVKNLRHEGLDSRDCKGTNARSIPAASLLAPRDVSRAAFPDYSEFI
jgi:hypothetical protein